MLKCMKKKMASSLFKHKVRVVRSVNARVVQRTEVLMLKRARRVRRKTSLTGGLCGLVREGGVTGKRRKRRKRRGPSGKRLA